MRRIFHIFYPSKNEMYFSYFLHYIIYMVIINIRIISLYRRIKFYILKDVHTMCVHIFVYFIKSWLKIHYFSHRGSFVYYYNSIIFFSLLESLIVYILNTNKSG